MNEPSSSSASEARAVPNWVWVIAGLMVVVFAVVIAVIAAVDDDESGGGGGATATIVTSLGDIVVALDTENAPIAAGHFVDLADAGAYDGSRWHRVVPDFVIQGGAPGGDITASGGDSVVGEVPTDNYPIGSIAAAKTAQAEPGTFTEQFFIVTGSQGATLPNDYARFGTVIEGLDVAQQIEALAPPEGDGEPTEPVAIERIEINQ